MFCRSVNCTLDFVCHFVSFLNFFIQYSCLRNSFIFSAVVYTLKLLHYVYFFFICPHLIFIFPFFTNPILFLYYFSPLFSVYSSLFKFTFYYFLLDVLFLFYNFVFLFIFMFVFLAIFLWFLCTISLLFLY